MFTFYDLANKKLQPSDNHCVQPVFIRPTWFHLAQRFWICNREFWQNWHISSSFLKFSLGETWSLGWHSSAKIDLLDNVNELVQHFFVNMPKPQQTKPWYAFDGRRRFISVAATLPRKISKVFFVSFRRPECNQIWFLKEAASSIIIFSVLEVMALFSHRC